MRAISVLLVVAAACASEQHEATVSVRASSDGTVTVVGQVDGKDSIRLKNAEVRVRIDGVMRSTRGADCVADVARLLDCDLGDGVRLVLAHQIKGDSGMTLQATVSADLPHEVGGFEVLATPAGGLELPRSSSRLRYLHNGYQSWSFAGALDVEPGTELPRSDDAIEYPAPNGTVAFDERLGLSSHDVVLDAGDGSSMVVGFVSVDLWHGAVALEHPEKGRRLVAMNGFTGDSVRVEAGYPVSSEVLLVSHHLKPVDAMDAYGSAIDERRDPARYGKSFEQGGWFSWNRFFSGIDEATVMQQAELLRALGHKKLDLVEIDDGWERAWGDWRPNEKFRPVAEISADLKARGQRLGLWAAPFVVEASLPVVEAHPEWWVRTRDGEPLEHKPVGTSRTLRVVDTTHPEALAWVVESLASLQRDGAHFFKFDYLYAAALDGVRHDPRATGAAALRVGLDAIFKALKTSQVNLCGIPWLHAALAPWSSIRIGADVAFDGAPYGFTYVAAAVRNLLARSFGPIAERSDLDQFWLAPLSLAETRTALTWQLMTGSTFALGDDLSELSAEQRELLSSALAHRRSPLRAAPVNPFGDAGDVLIGSPLMEALQGANEVRSVLPSTAVGGGRVVTNWSEKAIEVDLGKGWRCDKVSSPWKTPAAGKVRLEPHDSLMQIIEYACGD